jgi:hypothetical protein
MDEGLTLTSGVCQIAPVSRNFMVQMAAVMSFLAV